MFKPAIDDATSRGHSNNLWNKVLLDKVAEDPSYGWRFKDDFTKDYLSSVGTPYTTTLVGTTPTVAINKQGDTPYAFGGGLLLSNVTTTAYDGIQIQALGTAFKPTAGYTIFGEVYFQVYSAVAIADIFVGLSEIDTTVLATSTAHALTTSNHIGFKTVTGDGVVLFTATSASATDTTKACTTLVTQTNIKLGFKCVGTTKIDQYVNGVKQTTSQATAAIPVVGLTPTWAQRSVGSTTPVCLLKWWDFVQVPGEFPD